MVVPIRSLFLALLAVGIVALAGCDPEQEGEVCGGGTVCIRAARPILGDYEGTIQDEIAGRGRAQVSITNRVDHPADIEDEGFSDISGNWRATFANPTEDTGGFFEGTLVNLTVSVILRATEPGRCSYAVTAILVEDTRLEGTYTSFNCTPPRTGTFNIERD